MRVYHKSFPELCHFRSHYQEILPYVEHRAKPLLAWYIDCLSSEIEHRQQANARLKKVVLPVESC